jgi:beta-phosphoglucomutase-like phosphatase (HAD superfamily)
MRVIFVGITMFTVLWDNDGILMDTEGLFLTALERYRLRPDDCVVVEDSERGLVAATAAGLRCLVIPNDWTRYGHFGRALKILGRIADVPDEVFQLCRPGAGRPHG